MDENDSVSELYVFQKEILTMKLWNLSKIASMA